GIERFSEQVNQATYRQRAGLADEMGLEAIYAEHATLFADASLEALRRLADQDGDEADQARALLAFAVEERLGMEVAGLTDRIEAAESRAVIIWRGERIGYRDAWNRATDTALRAERNGLAESYYEAVEAINPMRQERFERMAAAVRALGYADAADMVRQLAG